MSQPTVSPPPTSAGRVLVVGTTPDYVARLAAMRPGGVVFLSQPCWADDARVAGLPVGVHLTADFDDPAACLRVARSVAPGGIACFDCDGLDRAADLAQALGLPFVPADAVAVARSKTASKLRWDLAGVRCPVSARVPTLDAARRFHVRARGPVVLKPLSGAGSELVLRCDEDAALAAAWALITQRLTATRTDRLFRPLVEDGQVVDPTRELAIEEFVAGEECSADVFVTGSDVRVLRFARKVMAPELGLGTVRAYVVPGAPPAGITGARITQFLRSAVRALGIDRGFCMVDFIARNGEAFAIEATPRPGGDSLPELAQHALGLDTLGAALDAARGVVPDAPAATAAALGRTDGGSVADDATWLAVNVFAPSAGTLAGIDATALAGDARVVTFVARRERGDKLALPPDAWDQRLVGCVLVHARAGDDIAALAASIAASVRVNVTPPA